jgi:hypothetical protein
MIRNENEARHECVRIIDNLVDIQKKNISELEIMKEHINDMTSEQFNDHFGPLFAFCIGPEISQTTMKAHSAIRSTNDTIEYIKEKEVE